MLLLGTFGEYVVLAGFIRYTPSVRVTVPGQVVESDTIIAQIVPTQVPLMFKALIAEKDISPI